MWRDIKKILLEHHSFLITTHINPDGDGMGAACALAELLIQMDKKVKVVVPGPIPSKFRFLDFHHIFEVFDPSGDYSEYQVLAVVDTHRKERLGAVANLLANSGIIAFCIDHHVPAETFTPYTAIDAKACCAGAMVYTLYKECGFDLNPRAAAGVYASVLWDTGRFSYSSTDRKAHKIADECIKAGVDPDEMNSRLFQHVSLAEIKMFANALQHMEMHIDNKVVVQQILWEDYHNVDGVDLDIEHIDLEYINDFNKMIEDVECIVLLRELPGGYVRASLRSKSELDVNPVVHALGGGGHSKAGGATCKGALSEVKRKIISLLQGVFDGKIKASRKSAAAKCAS